MFLSAALVTIEIAKSAKRGATVALIFAANWPPAALSLPLEAASERYLEEITAANTNHFRLHTAYLPAVHPNRFSREGRKFWRELARLNRGTYSEIFE